MTITLDSTALSEAATDLTPGGKYSIFHRGTISAAVQVDGDWLTIYEGRHGGGIVLMGLPGDSIQFTLSGEIVAGASEASIELTEIP